MGWTRKYDNGNGEARFSYCWRDAQGRQREKRNFNSARAAKKWGDQEAALTPARPESGRHDIAPLTGGNDPLFRTFALDWWETNGSDASRRSETTVVLMGQQLRDYLLPTTMLGGRRLGEIDQECLDRYASGLSSFQRSHDIEGRNRRVEALSNASKNRTLSLVRQILRSAKRQGKWPCEVDWSELMFDESEDAEDVDLSNEQLELLLDCVPRNGDAPEFFFCLAVLGLRRSELLAVRRIECDFAQKLLKVKRQRRRARRRQENHRADSSHKSSTKKPKWQSMRDVHMGPAADVLKGLAERRPNGPLFRNDKGDPLDQDTIRRLWDQTKREAARRLVEAGREDEAEAIADVKVHWLRHRYAVEALRRGASLTFLMEQMGHSEHWISLRYGRHDRSRRPPEPDNLQPPKTNPEA